MTAIDQAESLLRACGGRVTPARRRVLAALLQAPQALTHHELECALAEQEALDRVTLYRVLEWLVRQGLAHKIAGEDRIWRFNAVATPAHRHAHFHCLRCHRVFCLETLPTPAELHLPEGFSAEGVELTVAGRCPHCA